MWAKLHKSGGLQDLERVEELVYEDEEEESLQMGRDESDIGELDRLQRDGDAAGIVDLVTAGLGDAAFEHSIDCLVAMGELSSAWRVLTGTHGIGGACWRRTALRLGRAALDVAGGDTAADRGLAKNVTQLLVERKQFGVAAAVMLEFAVADAQAGANRLAARRGQGQGTSSPTDGAVRHDAMFDRALQQMTKVVERSLKWNVPGGAVDRWNVLLRLVAKQRCMPKVFSVLDAMDRLGVKKDHETYEFISRAAVSKVSLQAVADSFETMPPAHFPEIVFLGRSNVGKSSLVNSLLHRSALAPVAATPGHTTRFYFYDVNKTRALFPRMTLVDVPGLGVAVTEQTQLDHWKSTLFHYLRKRGSSLRGIFHLVSAEAIAKRRALTDIDVEIVKLAQELEVEYTLVLTKVDNLKNKNGTWAVMVLRKFLRESGLFIDHAVTSSIKTRRGRDQLWARLWSCVDPENPRWTGPDLLDAKEALDQLASSGAGEELAARAADLEGDAWEHAVRCLLRLGELRPAWRAVTDYVGSSSAGGASGAGAAAAGAAAKTRTSPLQERAALAVGEAALQVSEEGVVADEALAEDVLAYLEKSKSKGAKAELLLEFAVAAANAGAAAATDAVEARSAAAGLGAWGRPQEALARVVENARKGGERPWSVDRWNRLLRWALEWRDLGPPAAVLDSMAELGVKENAETRSILAEAAVASVDLVAPSAALQPAARPALAFVEACGEGSTLLLDSLLLSGEGAVEAEGEAGGGDGLVARAVELNSRAQGAGIPPATCLDVSLSIDDLENPACADDLQSLVSRVRASERPLSVLHVVSAEGFVAAIRAEAPNFAALGHRLEVDEPERRPEDLALSDGDRALQAAAFEGGASRYTLVVVDSDELGSEPRKRKDKVKLSRAHPKVIQRRKHILAKRLRTAAEQACAGGGADIDVLLVETRTGEGITALWRRLWQCALPPPAPALAEDAAKASAAEADGPSPPAPSDRPEVQAAESGAAEDSSLPQDVSTVGAAEADGPSPPAPSAQPQAQAAESTTVEGGSLVEEVSTTSAAEADGPSPPVPSA